MSEQAADPGVPSARFFSTVPGEDGHEEYVAFMSKSWQAALTDPRAPHTLDAMGWIMGSVVLTTGDLPAHRLTRSPALVRADQMDHYNVHLPLVERGLQLEADGDHVDVPSGAPAFFDMSRPFDSYQGTGRGITAWMSREALDDLLPGPLDLHAVRLRGAAAAMLSDHMQSLMHRLPSMTKAEANALATVTLHLVLASLAPTAETLERARPAIESSLLRQACRYIELHLKDPGLDAMTICAALKVSRTTLYRLFEPYGGVFGHVKERRLVRIHAVVSGATQRVSLSRIAEDHGFKSAAHFSRAFRLQFGYSPSEAPVSAAAPPAQSAHLPRMQSLAAWLRPLRG